MKRAGLDYWSEVTVRYWPDLAALQAVSPAAALSTPARKHATATLRSVSPPAIFSSSARRRQGFPKQLLAANPETCIRIPMTGKVRSLNLSTAAGIILYEALRQTGRLE